MEHRCGRRVRIGRIVRVADIGGWTATARLRDLSVSGAFLECSKPPYSVTWLRVELQNRPRPESITGDVIRRAPDGIAVEWREFAPLAVKELLASLQRKQRAAAPHTDNPEPSTHASASRPRTFRS